MKDKFKDCPILPPLEALKNVRRMLDGTISLHYAMDPSAKVGLGEWIDETIRRAESNKTKKEQRNETQLAD